MVIYLLEIKQHLDTAGPAATGCQTHSRHSGWMRQLYVSRDDACQAFDAFARLEPQLTTLWDLCRRASPPAPSVEPLDDAYDVDPFEDDALTADNPDDGRCAEDYFHHHVKSKLLALVGAYRVRGPRELQTNEAYETVHDLLINWALHRPCACCADHDDAARSGDDGSLAHW
jgi:hypothetical protein